MSRVELRSWRSSPGLRHPFMVFHPPFFSLVLSCLRGFESHESFLIDLIRRVLARSPSYHLLPASDVRSSIGAACLTWSPVCLLHAGFEILVLVSASCPSSSVPYAAWGWLRSMASPVFSRCVLRPRLASFASLTCRWSRIPPLSRSLRVAVRARVLPSALRVSVPPSCLLLSQCVKPESLERWPDFPPTGAHMVLEPRADLALDWSLIITSREAGDHAGIICATDRALALVAPWD